MEWYLSSVKGEGMDLATAGWVTYVYSIPTLSYMLQGLNYISYLIKREKSCQVNRFILLSQLPRASVCHLYVWMAKRACLTKYTNINAFKYLEDLKSTKYFWCWSTNGALKWTDYQRDAKNVLLCVVFKHSNKHLVKLTGESKTILYPVLPAACKAFY